MWPRPACSVGSGRRAFVGHVEPFDWTLSFPPNRQVLTDDLTTCLYEQLCSGLPVGLAMSTYYRPVGSLLQGYVRALRKYSTQVGDAAKPGLDMYVYSRVTAHDRASTVILGDPNGGSVTSCTTAGDLGLEGTAAARAMTRRPH